MLCVDYIDNFETKALDTIRDLSAYAERADIAVAFLTYRGWLELKPCLTALVARGGALRIIVRRDVRITSAEALKELFQLERTQLAFGLTDSTFHPKDYLFYSGKKLSVLTSSANATYPGLTRNDEGGAIITHPDFAHDEAAQKIIRIFERRWQNAALIDARSLAQFAAETATPSFAESDLVRSTNELFRDYGVGYIQKVRGAQAKVEFNPSVFMQPPYRSENKVLQLAELERIDSPLERAARGEWDEAWRFELKMHAARFLTGNIGGQLSNARTEILPHQIFAAHRVVSAPLRRFLLADEVGLGKTIEAGMIWQALAQRGQARRTLIITPAGLTTQWQEEMQDKFDALFEVFKRDFQAVNPRIWDLKAAAIASIDTLKRPEHKRALLENRKWDLIIFDEAHRLSAINYGGAKTDKTQNYRLAEEIRRNDYCEALLLLTATPHQGEENHSRFKNLLLLLDDNIDFGSLDRIGLFSGIGTPFTELVIRTPKQEVTDAHGRKVFKGRQTHKLPFKMYPREARFYNAVAEYIRDGYQMLERFNEPQRRQAAGFVLTTFQKLNASSTAAIRSALAGRLARLTGQLADFPLPAKRDEEESFFDERYEGEQDEQDALLDDRELMEDEIRRLETLLSLKVKRDKKLDELLSLVDHIEQESPRGTEEKILIFTEYRETQRHLVRVLEERYGKGSVVVIHGGIKLDRREEAEMEIDAIWSPFARDGAIGTPTTKRTSQRLFRDHPRVRFLVSTEAGGEGINLQFCHICVNYDLPWNPMRVEQRIGRVYRYGQNKVVQVYNFFNQGTIEEKVQTFFENRLKRAAEAISQVTHEDPEDIKGTLNGQLELEIDPAKIYQRALVEGDLNKQTQQQIAEAIERAKRAYEIATQSLFRDVSSYSFDSYQREIATDLSLADLRIFTERFLAKHRRQIQQKDSFLEFIVPDVMKLYKLPERYRMATFERTLAIERPEVEFLALGHSFIDAMLSYVGSYDFGGITAIRHLNSRKLAGTRGFLFIFAIRQRITREGSDECLFQFEPVFVTAEGHINNEALALAMTQDSLEEPIAEITVVPDTTLAFRAAKDYIEQKASLWEWTDDVEFLGLSWVEFS
ncbi:MAG TPA: helicase-related protein [Pyrinomonadaceae bacterium]|nr:helicase-related protein [Pyrinomonadaceae bacterium]